MAGEVRAAVAAAPQPVHIFILDYNGISTSISTSSGFWASWPANSARKD